MHPATQDTRIDRLWGKPSAAPVTVSAVGAGGVWTDERVDIAKRMWAERVSAAKIAAVLGDGITRNAVIGKLRRLGLLGLRPKRGKVASVRPWPRLVDSVLALPPRPCPTPVPVEAPPLATRRDITAQPVHPTTEPVGVPFLKTRRYQCRYQLAGDGMHMVCCGARTTGSYCARHAALIYAARATREEERIGAELRRRRG